MTASTPVEVARYRANRQAEIDSAALYRALSKVESDTRLAGVFARMAEKETAHAAFWGAADNRGDGWNRPRDRRGARER